MADFDTTRGAAPNSKDHKDILARARKDYDRAYEREKKNIQLAYEDLEFLAGEDYAQWPEKQRKERDDDGRPVLQINELPKFVHQITGDIRQMKPAIKVVPVDSGADEKIADLRGGLIRYIENRSDASAIYFRTADSQVACGIGHWRVQREYADSSTFNQEIRIDPIEDGVSVLWDPDAVLPTREDAKFCFVPMDMNRLAFEEAYPGITPSAFDDTAWGHNAAWCTDDYVRIAEYWLKKPTKKVLALGLDGAITDVTEADASVLAYHRAKGARIEQRDSTKVCRYLVTAAAVLEGPEDWPGRFIPIVPVVGEETRIGRRIIRNGIVRNAKDPQRMRNYFHSAHTEVVALQPKAPFMVTEKNVAKYQAMWETANNKNYPYLVFEPDNLNGGQSPSRIQPPVSSQGILDGLNIAGEDLKAVIGIYDAGLGQRSNETSGKAIIARQREGDVGSYLYVDNFARAVRQTGNIINDLIPYVYDTERTIRIMGEDGKIDVLEINKAAGIDPNSGETIFTHDMTSGSYDVVATVGPSYTTRREEAKEGMTAFIQAAPETAPLILDLVAKAQDWPMADDVAKRVRSTLPPQIIKMEELEKQGATPEQIQQVMDQEKQNQPPDPETVKAQMEAENNQARLALDTKKAETDAEVKQAEMQQAAALAAQSAEIEMAKMAEASRMKEAELAQQAMLERERIAAESETKRMIESSRVQAENQKINADAATAERNAQMEAAKMAEASRLKELELAQAAQLERERMDLDARVKLQIAEINARSKEQDAALRAATAKYTTDNRPQPNGAGQAS